MDRETILGVNRLRGAGFRNLAELVLCSLKLIWMKCSDLSIGALLRFIHQGDVMKYIIFDLKAIPAGFIAFVYSRHAWTFSWTPLRDVRQELISLILYME